MALSFQVTIDARDPHALAEFWAIALDYSPRRPATPRGTSSATRSMSAAERSRLASVVDPSGAGPRLLFQRVPEPKEVKNRVHLDVDAGAGAEDRRVAARTHAERLVAAGATLQRDEPGGWCLVLQDPEGNEFCVQ